MGVPYYCCHPHCHPHCHPRCRPSCRPRPHWHPRWHLHWYPHWYPYCLSPPHCLREGDSEDDREGDSVGNCKGNSEGNSKSVFTASKKLLLAATSVWLEWMPSMPPRNANQNRLKVDCPMLNAPSRSVVRWPYSQCFPGIHDESLPSQKSVYTTAIASRASSVLRRNHAQRSEDHSERMRKRKRYGLHLRLHKLSNVELIYHSERLI